MKEDRFDRFQQITGPRLTSSRQRQARAEWHDKTSILNFCLVPVFHPLESSFVMHPGQYHDTKRRKLNVRLFDLCGFVIVASICACSPFLLHTTNAAQRGLPSNTLWEVVHNLCVPGQAEYHDPKPCLQVDLTRGIEGGFAILRDPRGGTQFLLVPTTRISGIESPIIRGPGATNYFADAWEVRAYLNDALHQTLPRDGIGMAINSAVSRSQNQLHIHFSCIGLNTLEALRHNEKRIGEQWALLDVSLSGHYYMAMWVTGEHLGPNNPFKLLADGVRGAARDMGSRTLVVVGLTRRDGLKGFVILVDQVNKGKGDQAFGEELLDRTCHIAKTGNQVRGG